MRGAGSRPQSSGRSPRKRNNTKGHPPQILGERERNAAQRKGTGRSPRRAFGSRIAGRLLVGCFNTPKAVDRPEKTNKQALTAWTLHASEVQSHLRKARQPVSNSSRAEGKREEASLSSNFCPTAAVRAAQAANNTRRMSTCRRWRYAHGEASTRTVRVTFALAQGLRCMAISIDIQKN